MKHPFPLITILGPTAVGKTKFAANLARTMNGEIISADSRQVFRKMNIGTGKDLEDYKVDDQSIPYHLIDIAEPGSEYNLFQYVRDFQNVYSQIIDRGKTPVLCGGTGLYLEAILKNYQLQEVPLNKDFTAKYAQFSVEELTEILKSKRPLHNTTDILDRERLLRAIEIERYKDRQVAGEELPDFSQTPVFGITFERSEIRRRITQRLEQRLEEGMISEVKNLFDTGVHADRLKMYGLEYKYITMFLCDEISYSDMFRLLNTAIHQFAKRQMTWYRRMERNGLTIHWLDGNKGSEPMLSEALSILKF